MSQQNSRPKDIVKRRRVELGMFEWQDLADAAGVHRDTIGNILSGRTDGSPATLSKLARALQWPEDRLDYVRRGETPPPETKLGRGEAAIIVEDPRTEHRSGLPSSPGTPPHAWETLFGYGAIFSDAVRDAGMVPLVAMHLDDVRGDRPGGEIRHEGETVALLEIKLVVGETVSRDQMAAWTDRLKSLRLDTTVIRGESVAVIGWFVGEHAEAALEPYGDELERLHEVYDIHVPIGRKQLRGSLDEIAKGATT